MIIKKNKTREVVKKKKRPVCQQFNYFQTNHEIFFSRQGIKLLFEILFSVLSDDWKIL